jgi:RNA polymerase sigma-70 factor (ECF subfamily)
LVHVQSSIADNGEEREFETPDTDNPLAKIMNAELYNVLEGAVDKLPGKYRMVYLMREIEGMSVAETSASLGISEVNVKVRLNRAKEMLRKDIGNAYGGAVVYHFDLVRCDRIVANVMKRVRRY